MSPINTNYSITNSVLKFPENNTPQKQCHACVNDKFINNNHRKNVAIVSSVFSIGTILAALFALSKARNAKMFNMKLSEGDVFALGGAAVVGGTVGGCIADKRKNHKAKIREASHQIIGNIAAPLAVIYAFNKGVDKFNIKLPKINSTSKPAAVLNGAIELLPRLVTSCAGLWLGINVGNKVSNVINNKIFGASKNNRAVKAADYCIHVDDPITALTLADKSGSLRAFTGKVMPFVFLLSGYEAAMAEEYNI